MGHCIHFAIAVAIGLSLLNERARWSDPGAAANVLLASFTTVWWIKIPEALEQQMIRKAVMVVRQRVGYKRATDRSVEENYVRPLSSIRNSDCERSDVGY